jgi:hypothetical protein
LLAAVDHADPVSWLREIPAINILWRRRVQNELGTALGYAGARQTTPPGGAAPLLLGKRLERCRVLLPLKTREQQRTDSTHVLAAIRVLNRLELLAEAF